MLLYACVIYVHVCMYTRVDCAYVHAYRVHMLASSVFLYYYLLFFFFQNFYLHLIMYSCPWKPEEGVVSTGAGVLGTRLVYWKLNSTCPEKQRAVLTIESSV